LFYYEEKTMNETALILGLTESNAKVKLHRVRKKIYVLIKQEEV
ncbi:RNA polymerase subunit sigma-70, partial [Bacteroides intestinalis]